LNANGLFDNAMSSLKYAQAGLLVTAQNVSGAAVDGFVRRTPESLMSSFSPESARPGQGLDGFGRNYSTFLQRQLLRQAGQTSYTQTLSAATATLDKMLTDPATSVAGAMGSFFNAAGSLANEPQNPAYRESLIGTARQLAGRINTAADVMQTARDDSARGLEDTLRQANDVMSQLGRVNAQIKNSSTPDLFDERDRLGMQLQRLVGGNSLLESDGTLTHQVGGVQVVEGATAYRFTNGDGSEPLVIRFPLSDNVKLLTPSQGSQAGKIVSVFSPQGNDPTLALAPPRSIIERGQAGAYITLLNQELPAWQRSLDLMTADLVRQVNAVQGSTGSIQPLLALGSTQNGTAATSSPQTIASQMGFVLSGSQTQGSGTSTTALNLQAPTSASVQGYRVYINGADSGSTVSMDERTSALTLSQPVSYSAGDAIEFRGTVAPYLTLLESAQIPGRVVAGPETSAAGTSTKNLVSASASSVPVKGYRVFINGLDTGAQVLSDDRSGTAIAGSNPPARNYTLALDKSISYSARDRVEFRYVPNTTLYQSLANGVFSSAQLQVPATSEDSQFVGFDATAATNLQNLRSQFNAPVTSFTSRIASTLGSWNQDLKLNQTLERSLTEQKSSVSGVNLDEEAAHLVRYQQIYAAASKMVQMSGQMFDTLFSMLSGR
jgi:flagellar hook-associated protein 1 FlgK